MLTEYGPSLFKLTSTLRENDRHINYGIAIVATGRNHYD